MTKKLWGNMLVKNEDRYIWFAVKSVIDQVDKLLIWDTGSTDQTVKIVEQLAKIYPEKIVFEEKGLQSRSGLTQLRQKMLNETLADWLLILDGDEVWWKESLKTIRQILNQAPNSLYALVQPTYNLAGDIYHYLPDSAGQYQILNKKGHFNIRLVNKMTPGLHLQGDYPNEGFYTKDNILIQNLDKHLKFVNLPILHFTHLRRSRKGSGKIKHVFGKAFNKTFVYPEVLFLPRPQNVISPWQKRSSLFKARAALEIPLRKLKSRL